MPDKNYYEILGVSPKASVAELKSAYRNLARKYHPDASHDETSAAVFQMVQEAYNVLSDPEKRREFDNQNPDLIANYAEAHETYQRKQQDSSTQQARPWPKFDFGEDSSAGFGGPAAARFRDPAENVPPAEDENYSGEKKRSFFGKIRGGSTSDPNTNGSAQRRSKRGGAPPPPHKERPREFLFTIDGLESIKGTSREIAIQDEETPRLIRVKVPPGVFDGAVLNVKIDNGDTVTIRIRVVPHPLVERLGHDVILNIPISIREAAYGAEIEVPTPSGPVRVKLPPKSREEKRLRLKGRGITNENDGTVSDLYVQTYIVLPDEISEDKRNSIDTLETGYHGSVRQGLPSKL